MQVMEIWLIVLASAAVWSLWVYFIVRLSRHHNQPKPPPIVAVAPPPCSHPWFWVAQQPDGRVRIWCSDCGKWWDTLAPLAPVVPPAVANVETVPACQTCADNGCQGWCRCSSCHLGVCDG